MRLLLHRVVLSIILLGTSMTGCHSCPEINITAQQTLGAITGASGTEQIGDTLFVAGDNAPYFAAMDTAFTMHKTIPFGTYSLDSGGRIPKPVKPDIESLVRVSTTTGSALWGFGSGSKAPQRDSLFIYHVVGDSIQTVDLSPLYNQLRNHPRLNKHELNIEGSAIAGNHLLLFNRDGNFIFSYSIDKFKKAIARGATLTPHAIYHLQLPKINGIEAGLSGADFNEETSTLFFTASVEDTPNAYDDGPILGSFIGSISLKNLSTNIKPVAYRLNHNTGRARTQKIESITIMAARPNNCSVLMAADNDGASQSTLFIANIRCH